jgi:hypothetical protein
VLAVHATIVVLVASAVWLAARHRRNWARWLLLVFWLLELPLQAAGLLVTELGGVEVGRPSVFVTALVPLEWAVQATALAHAFTGDARHWFAGHARPARLLDIAMPLSVARFEAVAYSALLLGVLGIALGWTTAPRAAAELLTVIVAGPLTWLIVRRRVNWARWLFVMVAGAWLGYVALAKLAQAGWLVGALNVLQEALWVAALWLLNRCPAALAPGPGRGCACAPAGARWPRPASSTTGPGWRPTSTRWPSWVSPPLPPHRPFSACCGRSVSRYRRPCSSRHCR